MPPKPRVARQIKAEFDVYAFLAKWSRTVLQFAIIGFVISLGYILYAMFSGVLNQASSASAGDVARLASNMRIMGQVLALCSFVGALAFVILTLSELAFAVAIGVVGVGLMFGMPILVATNLAQAPPAVVAVINEWTRNAGMAILLIVGLRILYEIVETLRTAGARRREREEREEETGLKKTKKSIKPAIWSPCWGLPYCHDAVREQCPAFKARRSCWRYGSGCNCDPSLIERLIRSGALDTSKGASRASSREKAAQAAYVRSDLQADAPLKTAERTIPCSRCPIYLDHQRQKFKIVNPIAIIATMVAMAVLYAPLKFIYFQVVRGIAGLASQFSFHNIDPGTWFKYLETPALQVFFFIIVGLLGLAYVLKFVEWAIFEKKL
ncbi:MAG: hypothetical protein ABFE08_00045 [Armatimonadia bacterium]